MPSMENYDAPDLLNVGVGEDLTIAALAALVARVVGYSGRIVFDPSFPDGTPRKLLDVSRIHVTASASKLRTRSCRWQPRDVQPGHASNR